MEHEPTPDKKRKFDTADSHTSTGVPHEDLMFLSIIEDRLYNYSVTIDPVLDKMIYDDLVYFEKSKINIQMNNYEPESLYELYEGSVACPDKYVAWMEFFRNISTRKNPEKFKQITLNRESLPEIQKARWFVSFCVR